MTRFKNRLHVFEIGELHHKFSAGLPVEVVYEDHEYDTWSVTNDRTLTVLKSNSDGRMLPISVTQQRGWVKVWEEFVLIETDSNPEIEAIVEHESTVDHEVVAAEAEVMNERHYEFVSEDATNDGSRLQLIATGEIPTLYEKLPPDFANTVTPKLGNEPFITSIPFNQEQKIYEPGPSPSPLITNYLTDDTLIGGFKPIREKAISVSLHQTSMDQTAQYEPGDLLGLKDDPRNDVHGGTPPLPLPALDTTEDPNGDPNGGIKSHKR